jgi:hypothetical protein
LSLLTVELSLLVVVVAVAAAAATPGVAGVPKMSLLHLNWPLRGSDLHFWQLNNL